MLEVTDQLKRNNNIVLAESSKTICKVLNKGLQENSLQANKNLKTGLRPKRRGRPGKRGSAGN